MTRDTMRVGDRELSEALDRLDPPPLSPGFADRVVAAAQARSPAALPRARRAVWRRAGAWTRGRRAVLGSAALLFAGATAAAAATGLLGDVGAALQPVERMVERVAAAVPGLGRGAEARPAPPAVAVRAPAQASVPPEPAPRPVPEAGRLEDPRRERLAQVLAARLDRRIARAEARGIAVPERLRDTDRLMSPERAAAQPERAEIVARVQQIRKDRQQAASNDAAPRPALGEGAAAGDGELARLAERWAGLSWPERRALVQPLDRSQRRRLVAKLTPEQRQELVAMLRQRRAAAAGPQDF